MATLALKFVIPFTLLAFPAPRHNIHMITAVAVCIIAGTLFERYVWIGGINGTGPYPIGCDSGRRGSGGRQFFLVRFAATYLIIGVMIMMSCIRSTCPYSHRRISVRKGHGFEVITGPDNKSEDVATIVYNSAGAGGRDLLYEANIINEYIDERFPPS